MQRDTPNANQGDVLQRRAARAASGLSWFIVAIGLLLCYVGLIFLLNLLGMLIFRDEQRDHLIELSAVMIAAVAPVCALIGFTRFIAAARGVSPHIRVGLLSGCFVMLVTLGLMTMAVIDVSGVDTARYRRALALAATLLPVIYVCSIPLMVDGVRKVLVTCGFSKTELGSTARICILWSSSICVLTIAIIGHNTVQLWGGQELMAGAVLFIGMLTFLLVVTFLGWLMAVCLRYRVRCRDIEKAERAIRNDATRG